MTALTVLVRTVVLSATLLALAACGGPSDAPVPKVAKAPFACDGVPSEGARLMSGDDKLVIDVERGAWGDPEKPFTCQLETSDGKLVLKVFTYGLAKIGLSSPNELVDAMPQAPGAHELSADSAGGGYVYLERKGLVSGHWACGEMGLSLSFYGKSSADRDPTADVGNFLVSMLPWACGDDDPPKRTDG